MPVKNVQSKTQALGNLGFSDDADSESGVFILPVFAYFATFFSIFQAYFAVFVSNTVD